MARTNRRSKDDIERSAPKARRATGKPPPLTSDAALETERLRATVDVMFRNDAVVTNAVKENLKERTRESDAIAKRATKAFAKFSPSNYSQEERARRTYLGPGDKLADSLDFVVNAGAQALRKPDVSRGIRLTRTEALDALIKNPRSDRASTIGTIDLDDLLAYVSARLGASPTPPPDAVLTVCDAEAEAERRLAEIERSDGGAAAGEATATSDGGTASSDGDPSTRELVKSKVKLLTDTLVSPERPIRIDPGQPVDETDIGRSIDTFELRDGPSDVTSYHDFNSLQIAFQHVWTEVFDRELESLGRELFQEYVRLKDFAGLDDGKDATIGTVADLDRLITEIRELSRLTQDEIPGGSSAGGNGTSNRDVPAGAQDLGDVVGSVLTGSFIENEPLQWILNPAGAAIEFLGDLFANKQQVNWESFESGHTLPGGIDVITATVEPNAVPQGTVEIVLTNSPGAPTWKGIDFYELDTTGRPVNVFKIANDPRDRGVWDSQSYNRLPLYTQQVRNGVLEFGKEITFGAHKAHYFLIGLDEKLKDRTRVTFNWQKDK